MRTIVRLRQADEDLIAIWQYIADRNPTAADRVLDAIERRWTMLAANPFAGPAREDLGAGVRCLASGTYLTLYRVGDDAIDIIRVLHGRRKIDEQSLASE